jgi:hypothetical protein
MRRWWPRWSHRPAPNVSALPASATRPPFERECPVSADPLAGIDHQLAEAAVLLRVAREAGDTAEVERLTIWIDQHLDQRLADAKD